MILSPHGGHRGMACRALVGRGKVRLGMFRRGIARFGVEQSGGANPLRHWGR